MSPRKMHGVSVNSSSQLPGFLVFEDKASR